MPSGTSSAALTSALRGTEVRHGLMVRRHPTPAIEEAPRGRRAKRPGRVERGLSPSVRADATDIGQEVPRGQLDLRVGGRARE